MDHLLVIYPPRLTRRPHETVLCVGGTARHVPASMQAVRNLKYAHRTQLSADRTPPMHPTHARNDQLPEDRRRRSERAARAQRPRALRYCLEGRPPGSSSERPGRQYLKRACTRAHQTARSSRAIARPPRAPRVPRWRDGHGQRRPRVRQARGGGIAWRVCWVALCAVAQSQGLGGARTANTWRSHP